MQIGSGVTLRGVTSDENLTWLISGTVTTADVGKPLTQDTSAANTAKLAGDGDPILGQLLSYENRVQEGITVGTVALDGGFRWPYTGTAPAIGSQVLGSATSGSVKAGAASTANTTTGAITVGTPVINPHIVVAVDTTAHTVDVLFI